MSTIHFSFVRSEDGSESIVLLGAGIRVIPDSHVNFARIKEALFTSATVTEADVVRLADAAAVLQETLRKLSERVSIKGETIYFDGDAMESRLTQHIVEMIREGDDNYGGYVAFLENVSLNPNPASRESLFNFLGKHDLIITEDGYFLGYKGVGPDGLSISSGVEDVTITLADGTVEVHQGHIPNPIGATVEMPRSLVDSNTGAACSVGLHVGNFRYANDFSTSGKFLTVKVNPRDVVSVPYDSNSEKIRTCRYVILEENEGRKQYEGTSWYSSAPTFDYFSDTNDPDNPAYQGSGALAGSFEADEDEDQSYYCEVCGEETEDAAERCGDCDTWD